MNTLFAILFYASFICLIVGLVKPSVFSRFIKGKITRKKIGLIFGITALVFFVLFGMTMNIKKTDQLNDNKQTTQTLSTIIDTEITQKDTIVAEKTKKMTEKTVLETVLTSTPEVLPKTKPTSTSVSIMPIVTQSPPPQTDRASMLVILKANASSNWGNDYQMVQFEYNNQVQAYDWVITQTKYPDIMTKAKNDWGNDYQMVKFEYNNQVEAYEWIMAQTMYPNIMASAKQNWGNDYQMVKFEYNNQVQAYKSLYSL